MALATAEILGQACTERVGIIWLALEIQCTEWGITSIPATHPATATAVVMETTAPGVVLAPAL